MPGDWRRLRGDAMLPAWYGGTAPGNGRRIAMPTIVPGVRLPFTYPATLDAGVADRRSSGAPAEAIAVHLAPERSPATLTPADVRKPAPLRNAP
jgi:hypothetical protein